MRYVIFGCLLASSAFAWAWGMTLTGGFGMPAGDYGTFAGASPVIDVRGCFCVSPYLNIAACVPYRVGHKVKNDFGFDGVKYGAVPILIGTDYRFEFLPCMPYAGGGVAAVISRATVPVFDDTAGGYVLEERKTFRPGAYGNGGVEYYLSENFGIDVRGRFIYALGGDKVYYKNQLIDSDSYQALDAVAGIFFYP